MMAHKLVNRVPIWSMVLENELPSSAICEKSGMMYLHQEEKKNLKKYFCVFPFLISLIFSLFMVISFPMGVRRRMEQ